MTATDLGPLRPVGELDRALVAVWVLRHLASRARRRLGLKVWVAASVPLSARPRVQLTVEVRRARRRP